MCYAARRVKQWWFSSLEGRTIFEKFADPGLLQSDCQPPSHPEPLGMQYLCANIYIHTGARDCRLDKEKLNKIWLRQCKL